METGRLLRTTAILLGIAFTASSLASAQALNSTAQTIALNASLTESLTVALSANAVNFTLASGSATQRGQHQGNGDDDVELESEPDRGRCRRLFRQRSGGFDRRRGRQHSLFRILHCR